ncbi:MAG: ribosome biogenesis GTPase Der [Vicinamibacteria bacterium]|nr:ribosome biogenesis GTPase Der [Vicinamibacteria bacterium]
MIPIPKIALVGRPNVGKSTLFNRICGKRRAIVDSRPGSTRDRNYAYSSWRGRAFEVVDTGGLLLGSDDPLLAPAEEQVHYAIQEADLVLLIVDGRVGLLPDDEMIARRLRQIGKRVVVAVNKLEVREEAAFEFSRLGFETLRPISAEHGYGIGELLDCMLETLPPDCGAMEEAEKIQSLRLALVGRPNVGKSSILNRLLGMRRVVVSPVPGTTRDAIDAEVMIDKRRFCLIDTAGIRKRRVLKETVDHVSVLQAQRSIRRSDVAALVIDAGDGVRELDVTVGREIRDIGRGVVIVVNKWDGEHPRRLKRRAFEAEVRERLGLIAYAPIAFVSARTGFGLRDLIITVNRAYEASRRRVTTGLLNRTLVRAVKANPPKTKGHEEVKILFGTQVGVAPPTFVLALNHPSQIHFSYHRYLENQLRSEFNFVGANIVIKTHARRH